MQSSATKSSRVAQLHDRLKLDDLLSRGARAPPAAPRSPPPAAGSSSESSDDESSKPQQFPNKTRARPPCYRGSRGNRRPPPAEASVHAGIGAGGDGRTVVAAWSVPEALQVTERDWVGLFIHDREFRYSAWSLTGGQRSGSCEFPGLANGFYSVRYFSCRSGSAECSCVSAPVLVGPAAVVSAAYARPQLLVRWSHGPACKGDWVGVYAAGTRSNRRFLAYAYADPGARELRVPLALLEAGGYEVRYFLAGSSGVLARGFLAYSGSAAFAVGPAEGDALEARALAGGAVEVRWRCVSQAASSYDWVGAYAEGADASSAYCAYAYVADGAYDAEDRASGRVVIDVSRARVPVTQVRFFSSALGKYVAHMKAQVSSGSTR
eukprot:m51a1_g652 hypothetical protein (379) ;mRNA; r:204255-205685